MCEWLTAERREDSVAGQHLLHPFDATPVPSREHTLRQRKAWVTSAEPRRRDRKAHPYVRFAFIMVAGRESDDGHRASKCSTKQKDEELSG